VNKKQQQKHVGQPRRLRPIPINSLEESVDDAWTVQVADEHGLQLSNSRTGHQLQLGYDHILEYRTPDFLILKSQVRLTPTTVIVEPFTTPPKVILDVPLPLPVPYQTPDGLWVQELHARPSKAEPVFDATVEVHFLAPYLKASYSVESTNPGQAIILRELFGVEGSLNSTRFRMGLVELPRGAWIRIQFIASDPPTPQEVRLTPYFKH
jgi:hypothetical protein